MFSVWPACIKMLNFNSKSLPWYCILYLSRMRVLISSIILIILRLKADHLLSQTFCGLFVVYILNHLSGLQGNQYFIKMSKLQKG